MKEYDLIVVGGGSAMGIVNQITEDHPGMKIAVVDKNGPGGISLTKGSTPSAILLHHADLVRNIESAKKSGIEVEIKSLDFGRVIKKARETVEAHKRRVSETLTRSNIDFYPCMAEFVDPYVVTVSPWRVLPPHARIGAPDAENITSKMFFLCLGSRPMAPGVRGLKEVRHYTSDNILEMEKLPDSLVIVGGGCAAAEYGHFFSAMGSNVTIIGRNPRFLPEEEPEVSDLTGKELGKHLVILTNHAVRAISESTTGGKKIVAYDQQSGEKKEFVADEVLLAAGRSPNTTFIHPVRGGIKTNDKHWVVVNESLETSQSNIWAFGDANGRHLFKHVGDYEARVVYANAILEKKEKVDYSAIPHAVFTNPEIAGVGLKGEEAVEEFGEDNVQIGFAGYQDTLKGEAMGVEGCFVKVIIQKDMRKILGAHIIGPHASILIQEIVTSMQAPQKNAELIISGMHIHSAQGEVVQRAFSNLMTPKRYAQVIEA